MEKQKYLFYENAKEEKKICIVFAIFSYVTTADGFYRLIVSPPSVALILMVIFCLSLAVCLNIFAVKAKRLKNYTAITENEMSFFIQGTLYTYHNIDLKDYSFVKKYFWGFTEYKLLFADDKAVSIRIRQQPQKWNAVLGKIIETNKNNPND